MKLNAIARKKLWETAFPDEDINWSEFKRRFASESRFRTFAIGKGFDVLPMCRLETYANFLMADVNELKKELMK
jgi:hypothetical protein